MVMYLVIKIVEQLITMLFRKFVSEIPSTEESVQSFSDISNENTLALVRQQERFTTPNL